MSVHSRASLASNGHKIWDMKCKKTGRGGVVKNQKTSRTRKEVLPVVFEDVQTNAARFVDVRVIDACGKLSTCCNTHSRQEERDSKPGAQGRESPCKRAVRFGRLPPYARAQKQQGRYKATNEKLQSGTTEAAILH